MRPVERGPIPNDALGNPKVFAQYQDARADLIDRLGRYCSFCERSIKVSLAVEHILHKEGHPDLELVWTNFLLACTNCNSTKGTKKVHRRALFFPDQDNTFRALKYSVGGRVSAHPALTPPQKRKATRLIRLVGLDNQPLADPQVKDLRWNDRREAWDKAQRYRDKYLQQLVEVDTIVDLCKADGHWSIWMTVFADSQEVRLALLALFPSTLDAQCFDVNGVPMLRPSGQI